MKAKTKKAPTFKVGKEATMLFHMYGIVSKEKYKVIAIEGDIVTLETDEDETKCKRFHMSTGACINDTNWGGAKRTLKI